MSESTDIIPMGWETTQTDLASREVGAVSAVAREESEIKAAIVVAKNFPRDEAACYARVMKSCQRPGFAECSAYSFPRGGQQVSGPSVDLAREMARCWGNIRYGLRIVSADKDWVHIKGWALDLETNNYIEAEDKFQKLIQRKNKRTGTTEWVSPDERDLRELVNRRGAILVRNSILQILPPDVTDDAMERCSETMRKAARGDIEQSKEQSIRRLVMAFDTLSISADMLAKRLGHELNLINVDELAELRKIYKAIADGVAKRDEYFDLSSPAAPQSSAKSQDLTNQLRGKPLPDTQLSDEEAERILREKSPSAQGSGDLPAEQAGASVEREGDKPVESGKLASDEGIAALLPTLPESADEDWFTAALMQRNGCVEEVARKICRIKLPKPFKKLDRDEQEAAYARLLAGEMKL